MQLPAGFAPRQFGQSRVDPGRHVEELRHARMTYAANAAGQCLSEKSSPSIVLPKPLRYHYGHAETCL